MSRSNRFTSVAAGEVVTVAAGWCAPPPSYDLYQEAYAHRAVVLGEMIAAAIQAAGALVRRVHAHHQRRRQARAIRDALRQLDDRTLRDLGFDRSEISSVAAEVTGEAACTRVRALQTMHGLPI